MGSPAATGCPPVDVRPLTSSLIRFSDAGPEDAAAIARLHTEVSEDLTTRFGKGHWSQQSTERGALFAMRHARVVTARSRGRIIAVARLATKKPWAIDISYFTPCKRPLYLTGMAVRPDRQGQGIGRRLVEELVQVAREWSGDAIRLDAYDAKAGAGGFYAKGGFTCRGHASYKGTPLVYYELLLR